VIEDQQWSELTSGAWCNYDNSVANDIIYGKYYNWYAMTDTRNVCPTGWHVPSYDEWLLLANNLGGVSVAGGKMKSISGWNLPNNGATNESGFSALGVGWRSSDGSFYSLGEYGYYWINMENPHSRNLRNGNATLGWGPEDTRSGVVVRCVKD
jgi:uncharacterized protein (TIGR02145 family)